MVQVFEAFYGKMGRRASRCGCRVSPELLTTRRVQETSARATGQLLDYGEFMGRFAQIVADKAMYKKPSAGEPQTVLQFPKPESA